MINARIRRNSINLTGHAPRPDGAQFNAACAVVSIMTLAVIDAAREIGGAPVKTIKEESGHIRAEWVTMTHDAVQIISAYVLGLERFSESYPGTIKLDAKEWHAFVDEMGDAKEYPYAVYHETT